jgi:hypothetical protein
VTIVRVHNLAHDSEPEPRSLGLRAEKRTENALHVVGRNAGTGVPHFNHHLRRLRIGRAHRFLFAGQQPCANVHVPFAAEGFEGVCQKVGLELAKLVRIGQKLRHVRLDDGVDRDGAAPHLAFGEGN